MGIDPKDTDLCSSLNVTRSFEVKLESLNSGLPLSDSNINCYTDGSRFDEKTGFGLGITRGDHLLESESAKLPDQASVFQAEVCAISRACEILKRNEARNVTIFSDSQSAL